MKSREEIVVQVRAGVAREIGFTPSDDFLFESMKFDSLSVVKLVLEAEDEFGVRIENEEVMHLTCIRDLVDLIERKLTCLDKS